MNDITANTYIIVMIIEAIIVIVIFLLIYYKLIKVPALSDLSQMQQITQQEGE